MGRNSFLEHSDRFVSWLVRNQKSEERTYFILTLVTGVAAGLAATLLNKIIHGITHLLETDKAFTWKTYLSGGALVLVSGFISTRFFPSTSGSGIPGVRVALAVFNGKIRLRDTLAKAFTSIGSLSSGMSLGREGPTVAITAGLGSFLGETFHLSKKKTKALVAVGSAGGLAAAFNTPIAAVIFTLEEVVGDLNAKVLGVIIIASVIAAVTAGAIEQNSTSTFSLIDVVDLQREELFFYLLIGIICPFLGNLWTKSVLGLRRLNKHIFQGYSLSVIMITFTVMAALSLVHPGVLGGGHSTIQETLSSSLSDPVLIAELLILKFFAVTICYGSGISGGLFMPTLLVGSLIGALVGAIASKLFPSLDIRIGTYALMGMGAYFVSVVRTPFTSILMIFEMTRNYNIILPLMLSNIVAYFIASRLSAGSIYEKISAQDGIHLPGREDYEILDAIHVEDAMVTHPFTLDHSLSVQEAVDLTRKTSYSGFPVMKNRLLFGVVSSSELGQAYLKGQKDLIIENICQRKLVSIYPDQSLMLAFHKLKEHSVSRILVVARTNNRRLVGIVTAEDIVNQFGLNLKEDRELDPNLEDVLRKPDINS